MKLITKPDDPFDYLLGLKKGGFQRTHGEEFDPSLLSKSGPHIGVASVEDREIDIARQIREVVESNIVIPKDMYIDDGDMPTAQNFYQWITEDRFGAIGEERPFMEQLIWATIAFNEACHVCSDKEWLYHTHKVDDTYAKFERKVALFEFGRCPHCGTTRADQINKGQMKYINELAVNAGQRCVVANTPVLTEHGVFRIVDTLPQNLTYGFTPFSINVHNGTEIESTVFAFKARPEPIYKVTFSNGCWIAGTKDHPILTKDGFVTLGDITVGTPVDFQYGMRQFGNVELPKYEAREYGINFSRGDVPPRLRLGNSAVYEEFLRGLFLSNGRRAFPNMDVLNDVSAMLFNVGVPHRIEAPSIVLSPEQYDLLHGGVFERGSVTETVTSVKIDGTAETFDYTLPSSHRFVTGGVISHNSGKSQTVGGFLSPYLTHRMLKLQKPAAYYGLTRNTVLHGTFVALTYVQAKDTLWTPFYGAISESKWFREYHALMRHYENKYGESLLKFNDTFVLYRHRGLTIYPAGPDKRILRGRTRYLASCFVGDTLISTNNGLIPIKDSNLVGMTTRRGSSERPITNWARMRFADDIVEVKLKNGMVLKVTGDHKVLTIGTDLKLRRTEANNLFGKYVGVTLGGDFPEPSADEAQKLYECVEAFESRGIVPQSALSLSKDATFDFVNTITRDMLQPLLFLSTEDYAKTLQLILARCGIISHRRDILLSVEFGADTSTDTPHHLQDYYKKGDPNIVWVEVVSVSKAKPEWVYDVTVDAKDHMLTANGIIAKNCDEIAYFDSNKDSAKVKVNAHEIYDALTNSLYTLRAAAERLVRHGYEDVFSGYSMNVTSPVAKNDMIHVLGKRAEESDSMYYVHRPTWEVNPDFPRNSKLITEAYRKDPESADKNFGANPPLIANPFLANHKMIRDLEDFDRKNAMRVRPVMKNSIKAGQGYMYGELDKIKRRKQASMCAIDAGSTDNSFSIAMGHRDGLNLVVDLVSEVIPLPGFRINHSLTYSELILPAMEARNVRVLLADRWNSIKLLDDAAIDRGDPESEEPTFIAKQYSLKYRDLVSVRTCIEQGIVRLPKSEIPVKTLLDVQDSDYRDFYAGKPVAHLFKQLFTIKDLEKSVGKGDGYTDDTWRAVALLVWGLLEEEFAGFLEAAPDEIVTVRPSAIAASKLYSGGGGSVGNGGGSLTTINGAPLAMIGRGKR